MLGFIYFMLVLVALGVIIYFGIVMVKEEISECKKEKEYNSHFTDTGDSIIFSITYDGDYDKELWTRLYTDFYSFKRRKFAGTIPQSKTFILRLTVVDKLAGHSEVMEYNLETHKPLLCKN